MLLHHRFGMVRVLAVITLLGVTRCGATAQDVFADIAAQSQFRDTELVEPPPPHLPNKVFRHAHHDPTAVFTPADKLDTPEELAAALTRERARTRQFWQTCAPAQVPTRTVIPISKFQWRVATETDLKNFAEVIHGAGAWTEVSIPHYGPPLGRTTTVYRTTFVAPERKTNQVVFIRFKGVDYKAHVFVNHTYVGSHEGFFAPFEFDVTPVLQPGSNVLTVRVENDFPTLGVVNDPRYPDLIGDKLYAATGPGFDDPVAGWHHCPPGMGIYQPVYLELRPAVHISDIFVRPLPEQNKIEVLVEVWSAEITPRKVHITCKVHGLNFDTGPDPVAHINMLELDPVGAGANFFRFTLPMPAFRWWSPDEPWLYTCQVEVACPELNTIDRKEQQFGMRSFRLDTSGTPKGRFLLNGREIKLRGANTMGFEQLRVMRGELDGLRDDLLLAKLCNMNFLRITQRPVQEEIYQAADRAGLLLQVDFPLFGHMRPNQFTEALRQMIEMERMIRSHPSCIMVSLINERFSDRKSRGKLPRRMTRGEFDRFFAAAEQVIRFANPDRVIKFVEGDYDPPAPGLPDNHCYTLWYFRHGIDFGRLHKGWWQPVKPGWNYTCGEFGAEGLDRFELLKKYCPQEWLAPPAQGKPWTPAQIARAQTAAMHHHYFDTPNTIEAWIAASRQHQAEATRLMTEAFRRDNRMIGFAIHLFIDAWPAGWMKAIMDVERQPKPAYFAYREALTPLMANIRTDRWKFFSGEPITCEFWICNDTHQVPARPILKWQLETNGIVVHAQQAPAVVKPMQAVFQGTTRIPAPRVTARTKATLRLALFDGTNHLHDTAVELEIFPKPAPLKAKVCAIGPANGPARRLLSRLGLKTMPLADAKVVLIDDFKSYLAARQKIDTAISNGVSAVFLALSPGQYALPGTPDPVVIRSANPHFCSRDTGHPLVSGFEQFDFRFWFDEAAGMITPLATGKFDPAGWEPVLKAQDGLAVGLRKIGRGCVVLCQLRLADRTRTNPTARLFVERLLALPNPDTPMATRSGNVR